MEHLDFFVKIDGKYVLREIIESFLDDHNINYEVESITGESYLAKHGKKAIIILLLTEDELKNK